MNKYAITYADGEIEEIKAGGMTVTATDTLMLVDGQATPIIFVAAGYWKSCVLLDDEE